MLTIHKEQVAAFEQSALDDYAVELMDHCREFSPHLCKTLRPEELEGAIREGITRAMAHGFEQRGPVRFYVEMMMIFGSGFDTDPLYPWAVEILGRQYYPTPMAQAEALHERAVKYLAKVDGKDQVHALQALGDLAEFVRRGISFRLDTFKDDTLRLMAEIHPRKVAETGEAVLSKLVNDGVARGRTLYGFQELRSQVLMVVLMFAFGHHFDRNPFLPWIGRALQRREDVAPDRAAERLERRALIWLDAVLRRAKEGE